jgi:hypothetical protein
VFFEGVENKIISGVKPEEVGYQKLRFIWLSSFKEDFLEIDQSETKTACGGHVC